MTSMDSQFAIENSCKNLFNDYARLLDFGHFDEFVELFSDDAHMNLGFVLNGKEAIRTSMTKRSPELRSRHVLTNMSINVLSDTQASGIAYLSLYRHTGPESLNDDPIEFSQPSAVGHYENQFVLTTDGWRIKSVDLHFAFRNSAHF